MGLDRDGRYIGVPGVRFRLKGYSLSLDLSMKQGGFQIQTDKTEGIESEGRATAHGCNFVIFFKVKGCKHKITVYMF